MKALKQLIILSSLIYIVVPVVLAQESSPAEQIRESVKEKVQEKIEGVTTKKVGLVGTLSLITEDTLEVTLENSEKKIVSTTEDTEYEAVNDGGAIDRDELELDSHLIVMGVSESGSEDVEARVVQLIDEPEVPERMTLIGEITKLSKGSFKIDSNGDEWLIDFSSQTDFFVKTLDGKLEDSRINDLEEGDLIIAGGEPVKDEDNWLDTFLILKIEK